MKPIYFPFTSISDDAMQALALFFNQIIVYQPSALPVPPNIDRWREAGKIEIRVPVDDEGNKLQQVVEAYHTWARQHQGTEFAYFKTRQGSIPFYDDASIHQIRTDIRRSQQDRAEVPSRQAEDQRRLMQARIFLQLAQEFDVENRAIRSSLDSQNAMERSMLQNLQGDSDAEGMRTLSLNAPSSGQPGDYMITERLAAWGGLISYDRALTGVFITDSRSALDTVLEKDARLVEIGQWCHPVPDPKGALQNWQMRFESYLDQLVAQAWPIPMPEEIVPGMKAAGGCQAILTLYIVPETGPRAFWEGHSGAPQSSDTGGKDNGRLRNTVIGLISGAAPNHAEQWSPSE